MAALSDQLEGVRKRMQDGRDKPDACKGISGYTEDDWRRLEEIRPVDDESVAKPPEASR